MLLISNISPYDLQNFSTIEWHDRTTNTVAHLGAKYRQHFGGNTMVGRGSVFLRIAAAVLLIGVLAVGGWMAFRAGQAQGYALGASQAAAQVGDGQGVQPVTPVYPGYYGGWHPHFFPFFPLGGLIGFLIFFFILGGLFRMILWGSCGPRPYPGGWRGGPWHHHHHYPWWGEPPAEGESAEKKPEQS
jgi:hypothetical protein